MWRIYDTYSDGHAVYEDECVADCVEFVMQRENPERFHLVYGDGPAVWSISGGIQQLAVEDVSLFMEGVSQGDYVMTADEMRKDIDLYEDIIARYAGYLEIDLNENCGVNFDYAIRDALRERHVG